MRLRRNSQPHGNRSKANRGAIERERGESRAYWAEVWMVSVLLAPAVPGVTETGEKVATAPVGKPVTDSVTGLLKLPLTEVTLMVKVASPPGFTVCVLGVPATPKLLVPTLMPVPESVAT
jgi:hypothetical protein